jgi:hypothetical protein
VAPARSSVTRNDPGIRNDSPLATHGRPAFVGFWIKTVDGAKGDSFVVR